jgi:uncharacterized protein (DUF2252 family)
MARPERARLLSELRALARRQEDPAFYRVLDIGRRVAGTGSLGVRRYVVLVKGRGGPAGEVLLDLKEALPSALAPYLSTPQPAWTSPAERIVTIQHWVQAASPALLQAVRIGRTPFVVRELQPTEDRLDLNRPDTPLRRLCRVVDIMGHVVAWAHLRSSGRRGSATTDEWMAFARRHDWNQPVLQYARDYAKRVVRDWETFRHADRAGRSR